MTITSEIIRDAKKDSKAFGKLYEEYVNLVYRFIDYKVRNPALSEDLTSQVWEKVLLHLPHLNDEHPAAFKSWLLRIARNAVFDHWKTKHPTEALEEYENHFKTESKEAYWADQNFLKSDVEKALEQLPPRERELIQLKFQADLKNQEIAKMLELSEHTVSASLARATQKLQYLLQVHRPE